MILVSMQAQAGKTIVYFEELGKEGRRPSNTTTKLETLRNSYTLRRAGDKHRSF
jgi:hypothetical protein